MRISDWSSDVCSSDLAVHDPARQARHGDRRGAAFANAALGKGAAGEHAEPVERLGEGREGQRERGFGAIDAAAIPVAPLVGQALIGRDRSAVRNFKAGEVERVARSEERRVGKEWVSRFCSRWSTSTSKKKSITTIEIIKHT